MREDTQDLKRRSYRMIKDNFIVVRGLQNMAGMKSSDVLEILGNVFRLSSGGATYLALKHAIKLVKAQEKKEAEEKQ